MATKHRNIELGVQLVQKVFQTITYDQKNPPQLQLRAIFFVNLKL